MEQHREKKIHLEVLLPDSVLTTSSLQTLRLDYEEALNHGKPCRSSWQHRSEQAAPKNGGRGDATVSSCWACVLSASQQHVNEAVWN